MLEINPVITDQHVDELARKVSELKINLTVEPEALAQTISKVNLNALDTSRLLPIDVW